MDAQESGNALYGALNHDFSKASRAVLAALARIEASRAELGAQAIGNALYGIQCMSSNAEAVLLVLAALAKKIEARLRGAEAPTT